MQLFEVHSEKMVHIQWFLCSCETVLGKAADPSEVYFVSECEDIKAKEILSLCTVERKYFYREWYKEGGKPEVPSSSTHFSTDRFFYSKMYHPVNTRFEDAPEMVKEQHSPLQYNCYSCRKKRTRKMANSCRFGEVLSEEEDGSACYSFVKWQKTKYFVGDCIFLKPGAFSLGLQKAQAQQKSGKRQEPLQVARIVTIVGKEACSKQAAASLRVRKFYRPEDTHIDKDSCLREGLNSLYYTKEEADVDLGDVRGKVQVAFSNSGQSECPGIWSAGNSFIFSKV